ncbi:ParB/RepB/Spo0J family partition protein [Arthrobacter sp. JUb115]|uniref:ParB/RepB/Spo0J family partition protein n=1 Tax=Arthrobacter sp. JUb115 TaxID=2485108 RepID=UPI00105D12CC|nr:ParB/RepB/Spo0J family partition protein [Arthrobacter sp. JUb115]
MSKFRGTLQILSITSVHENENNIREGYDAEKVEFLAKQIKSVGLIEPITVYPHPDIEGDYLIREENHRYLASLKAGETDIPCMVWPSSDRNKVADLDAMLSTGRTKNPLRESEISKGIQMALDLGQDITTIGKKHGMSRTEVNLRGRMAQRNDKLSEDFTKGAATLDTVKRLYELADQSGDPELYDRAIKDLPAGADDDEVEKHIVATEARLTKDRIKEELAELGAVEAPPHAPWAKTQWEQITEEMSLAEHHEAGHKYVFAYQASTPQWFQEKESAGQQEPEPTAEEIAEQEEKQRLNSGLAQIAGVRTKSIIRRIQDRKAVSEADVKTLLLKRVERWCSDGESEEMIAMITALPSVDGESMDDEEYELARAKWIGQVKKNLMRLPLANLVALDELLCGSPAELDNLRGFLRTSAEHSGSHYASLWIRDNFRFYGLIVNVLGYVLDAAEIDAMQYCAAAIPERSRELDIVQAVGEACRSCGTEPFEPTGEQICPGCAATGESGEVA